MDDHNKRENELRQRKFEVGDLVFVYLSGPGVWEYSPILERKKLPKDYGYIYKVRKEGYSLRSDDTEYKYYCYTFYTGGSGIRTIGELCGGTCFNKVWGRTCFGRTTKTLVNQDGDYELRCEKCGRYIKGNVIEGHDKFLKKFGGRPKEG